jgi:hypothetical protein
MVKTAILDNQTQRPANYASPAMNIREIFTTRNLAALLCTIFIGAFVWAFYLLIANSSQTAAIVASAKDLEDGYKHLSDLFNLKQAAADDADLADYDVSHTSADKQREDIVANSKRISSQNAFSDISREFFQIVCGSISEVQELAYPAKLFIARRSEVSCDNTPPPPLQIIQPAPATTVQK